MSFLTRCGLRSGEMWGSVKKNSYPGLTTAEGQSLRTTSYHSYSFQKRKKRRGEGEGKRSEDTLEYKIVH